MTRCEALLSKTGARCVRDALICGYCTQHFNKACQHDEIVFANGSSCYSPRKGSMQRERETW